MGATIYDIARDAGVSIATVSRVLNQRENVSDKTRQKVLHTAQRLGYVPNPSARNLAQRRVNVVSAVVPVTTTYFFMEVLKGVQERLAETDHDLLIFSSRATAVVDDQIARAVHRGRSGGVLLFSTPLSGHRISLLQQSDVPVVLVDSSHPDFDSVSTDSERGGYLATMHLLERGYRNIALIMGHHDSRPAILRQSGYLRAHKEFGLLVTESLIVSSTDRKLHGFTETDGYQAMTALLDGGSPVDAVFATSDIQAVGAMNAIRERGLGVPDDVAIVGFDDILISKHIALSTIHQPMNEMGRLAADKLLERIAEDDKPPTHTVFVPKLIERESSIGSTATVHA